jgi:hypothetical protein
MKTALKQIVELLEGYGDVRLLEYAKSKLDVERQQIIDAFDSHVFFEKGEDYYSNTYEVPDNSCDMTYYQIRSGKCEHGRVIHGKIVCELPECK